MRHILIIFTLVVSSCGFQKSQSFGKKSIDKDSVDYIVIEQWHKDSSAFRLNNKQINDFIDKWNNSSSVGLYKYIAEYDLTVHFKNGLLRNFRINTEKIKENNDYCYNILDKDFFNNVWQQAKISDSINDYKSITQDKFYDNFRTLKYNQGYEIIDFYLDKTNEQIPEIDTLKISEFLKKKGFKVANWGRGNWMFGPRIISLTLENDSCTCQVDKLYYTQDSQTDYKVTERILCKKNKKASR